MRDINLEFLKKRIKDKSGHKGHGGNNHLISDNIIEFLQYNFLPGTNPHGLDGHYTFYVNWKTFQYLMCKHANYGGLTWVREVEKKVFIPIHESIKEQVESIIASKLAGAYYYISNNKVSCSRGPNLIGNQKMQMMLLSGVTKHYYYEGYKGSLVCDYRDYPKEKGKLGYLSSIDKEAIKYLQEGTDYFNQLKIENLMNNIDYSKATSEELFECLKELVSAMTIETLLSYGDVHTFLREELNNEILDRWVLNYHAITIGDIKNQYLNKFNVHHYMDFKEMLDHFIMPMLNSTCKRFDLVITRLAGCFETGSKISFTTIKGKESGACTITMVFKDYEGSFFVVNTFGKETEVNDDVKLSDFAKYMSTSKLKYLENV